MCFDSFSSQGFYGIEMAMEKGQDGDAANFEATSFFPASAV